MKGEAVCSSVEILCSQWLSSGVGIAGAGGAVAPSNITAIIYCCYNHSDVIKCKLQWNLASETIFDHSC